MVERTDEEIALQVQKGDIDAFRTLVERYEPKMTRYAKRFFFDGDEGKDLVQEVFIKAYVNIQSFDASRRFSPWIYRIAHNEFVNNIKKRQKERDNVSIFDFDVLFPHLVAKETADEGFNKAEVKRMLEGCLDELNPKYKDPLVLYYFEDMDYREIAQVLRIPTSTVGVRLQRGRSMLKKLVKE
ncbi:MAG TPA: RNA polymerase sigma factor [Candidatus Paceibacterota bacterium]|nr:RNA polymerase sigma factor [Candidatus Paceibacterota bacterium]